MISKTIKYITNYIQKNIIKPKMLNFKYKEVLSKNLVLRDCQKGKRCFIIGGGPSVRDIDLAKLKHEHTFVVNEFDKHPQYKALNPDNFIMIDTAYFTHKEEHYFTKQFIQKPSVINKNVNIFINIQAKDYVEKKNIFTDHKLFFISPQGIFSDKYDFNIDISKTVPCPKNSILMCLIVAIYMGFEKIYLLGCEHNFLSTNIGLNKSLTYDHSYNDGREKINTMDPEIAKNYTSERDLSLTYEKQIANIRQLFKNYRLFYNKIKKTKPSIKIYNATPNSFLDVFPMIDFKDIKFPHHE